MDPDQTLRVGSGGTKCQKSLGGGRMTDEHNFLWILESFPCTLYGIIYFKKVNPKMKPKILC